MSRPWFNLLISSTHILIIFARIVHYWINIILMNGATCFRIITIIAIDLNILISVNPRMLMVKTECMHHLMLYVYDTAPTSTIYCLFTTFLFFSNMWVHYITPKLKMYIIFFIYPFQPSYICLCRKATNSFSYHVFIVLSLIILFFPF